TRRIDRSGTDLPVELDGRDIQERKHRAHRTARTLPNHELRGRGLRALDLIADLVEIGGRALRGEDAQCGDAMARVGNVAPCVALVGIEAIPPAGLDRIARRVTPAVGSAQRLA